MLMPEGVSVVQIPSDWAKNWRQRRLGELSHKRTAQCRAASAVQLYSVTALT